MHNLSLKIFFSIMLIAIFGLTVFGDVVPDEVDNSGGSRGNGGSLSDEYVGVCTGDTVRIRTSASEKSPILSSNTKKGDHFVVVGKKGDWCQIKLPEFISVWISRQFVKAEEGTGMGVVTGTNVNLRTKNSTKSIVIGKANDGEKVQIIAADSEWFLILPPANATGWISGKYIRKRGSVGAYADVLFEARNEYLARAAAYYESQGQSDLAKKYLSLVDKKNTVDPPPPPNDKELETVKYNALLLKYRQMDTNRDTADVAALKAFAQEVLSFAESCKSDVKDIAMNLYNDIMNITKSIEDYHKKMADDEAANKARKAAEAENKRILDEVDVRLMRKDVGQYVAKGVVVDKRVPETGESIYFLQINGEDKYRLVAINAEINIREFWRREIGIKGKIVYDENEEYPIVLCEQVDVFNAN